MPLSRHIDITQLTRRSLVRRGALAPLAFLAASPSSAGSQKLAAGSARACIFLHITGGPAQQETFDMKPNATGAARGEFNPIASHVPGIDVCELMPRTAQITRHLSIIRSLHHDQTFHGAGTHYNLTGFPHHRRTPQPEYYLDSRDAPSIGAVFQQLQGFQAGLPASVQLPYWIQQGAMGRFAGQDAGFLGRRFDPLRVFHEAKDDLPGRLPESFRLPGEVSVQRLDRRTRLLGQLNRLGPGHMLAPSQSGWHRQREQALEVLHAGGAWRAFSIADESPGTRALYGEHKFARSCLVARRLVEAGVKIVQVCWPGHENHFDTHASHFPDMKNHLLPPMDQAYAALISDLAQRGMLDETLVVWSGEFGRTPSLNGNKPAGRDHWPWVYTGVLAGGGIRGGVHVGSSDAQAAYPHENPVHVSRFVSTIYHALGCTERTVVYDIQRRPHHVLQAKPLMQLF